MYNIIYEKVILCITMKNKKEKREKMQTKMTLLSSQPYKIVNDKTGEINEGLTLFFHGNDNFSPKEQLRGDFILKGNKPFKANLPIEMESKIKVAPGLYDVEIEMASASDLKAQMKVVDINLIGEIEDKDILNAMFLEDSRSIAEMIVGAPTSDVITQPMLRVFTAASMFVGLMFMLVVFIGGMLFEYWMQKRSSIN
jgi:hypothetical protein